MAQTRLAESNQVRRNLDLETSSGRDEDWHRDAAQAKAYLDRLLVFTRGLSPAFNSLKAHVLFHRLALDLSLGIHGKALFVEYLKLPRAQNYLSKAMLDNETLRGQLANLSADYFSSTMLPTAGDDEVLVRNDVKHFFVAADSPGEFRAYINDVWLKHAFVETKIENGLGDPQTWAAQLPAELFRQLKGAHRHRFRNDEQDELRGR